MLRHGYSISRYRLAVRRRFTPSSGTSSRNHTLGGAGIGKNRNSRSFPSSP
jgi:hypothetical protein